MEIEGKLDLSPHCQRKGKKSGEGPLITSSVALNKRELQALLHDFGGGRIYSYYSTGLGQDKVTLRVTPPTYGKGIFSSQRI